MAVWAVFRPFFSSSLVYPKGDEDEKQVVTRRHLIPSLHSFPHRT